VRKAQSCLGLKELRVELNGATAMARLMCHLPAYSTMLILAHVAAIG